ncbi:beta-galactosidase 13-like isoform X2 [Andrographis paniculata]|uniref:beta-galactosidase 13-like isoform X2 n=1 Tax=Andrographis paniculata TaxID=175694 RepID=UPI0021E8C3ED|nr:beta-galactosidase 13-like isoform X2 [Andrographis paniculata]
MAETASSSRTSNFLLGAAAFMLLVAHTYGRATAGMPVKVTYDRRSIIVNGSRELLFSGSVHYTRSTPDMWPDIINKAKEGGLNLIQTYVFWNIHEPVQGQFNFSGNYDLVKFIRLIGDSGLWVTLRIGPYIEAEWNMGGFPYWLREVNGIVFRSDNEPFKYHMKRYAEMIVNLMTKEKLWADQGGPIILAQIENEYNNVQVSYREKGKRYIKWAAEMAVELYNGVPWIMCKQKNAPPSVISTCNGRQCGDTFPGPNGPDKPTLWTENWTAQYRVFGDSPSQRAAEDIAFSVARFFARNGTLNNYYMYHGGTNFGRTSSSFVTTRYYDEAPLDEYGLKREPKFGHLRDLHKALRLCKKPLLWGDFKVQKPTPDLEIITYESDKYKVCCAFLSNNKTREGATIDFRGVGYYLPPKSISILPDCHTVVYNTQTHTSRNLVVSERAKMGKWEMLRESIPTMADLELKSQAPMELYTLTKDTSDYAWYSTSMELDDLDLPMRADIFPVLRVATLGHALLAFVNEQFVGFGHGSNIEKSHVLRNPISSLKRGLNNITLLAMTVGFPNSGAYMEKRFAGPRLVTIEGLMSGTLDITQNTWTQQVGMKGERLQVFTEQGSKKVEWLPLMNNSTTATPRPVTWYKTYFDAPEGNDPVAIRMSSMGKGMVWVNGNSIGRYWVSYLSALQAPTQQIYHIPRAYLKPTSNLLVVFEDSGNGNDGDPEKIEIVTVNRDTICSVISEFKSGDIANPVKAAQLACPDNKVIGKVEFVGFGEIEGACGQFRHGNCTSSSSNARQVVEQECLGKKSCRIPMERERFVDKADGCPQIAKTLAIQVACAPPVN